MDTDNKVDSTGNTFGSCVSSDDLINYGEQLDVERTEMLNTECIKRKIEKAVDLFLLNDKKLLDLKVYEPAVSHRIAVYIECLFRWPRLNVDCEYDKSFDLHKITPSGNRIRPDILFHKRGSNDRNILVIEIKKHRKSKLDYSKLKMMTSQDGKFKYKFGVFIYFPKNNPIYTWFADGNEVK